ncbi:MAG TPA: ATP-binding protein [Actinomycetospora sp.]|uniref:sensor histidine kinase n=1 Tax=Actinomycetospora sp. TaxID=1872135 RepID=UPI002F3E930F
MSGHGTAPDDDAVVDPRSLRRLLAMSGVVGLVLLLLATVVAGLAMTGLDRDRTALVDRLDPAALAASRLHSALLDQETGIRGYALAGLATFLDPYRAGRAEETRQEAALRDVLVSTETRRDLDAVESAAAQWHGLYADPVVAATGARTALPDAGTGKAAFDRVRAATDTLVDRLSAERDAARAAVDRAATTVRIVGILVIVLLAIGLAVLLSWLRRVVVRPTERLAAEVREVADGDVERRVAAQGPREITALGRDVEAMRRALVAEMAGIEAARHELEEAGRELERSNSDLEQFAYVASHDLQEPLRKVTSFCQLLHRRYSGQLDERADQYIEFAVDGAKRMQVLINDLLAFSRVGRSEGNAEVVDTGAVLDHAVENLSGTLEESDGEITHDRLPRVRAEPVLLTTVFQNLLGNALKFRGDAPPRVHVSADRDGRRWLLRFSDNGLGIEPEYADRIFTIFQRLHPKSAYPGTGIGLAMCRKIVEHHGGSIWLEETAGPGSTFVVALPALEDDHDDDHDDDRVTLRAPEVPNASDQQEEARV